MKFKFIYTYLLLVTSISLYSQTKVGPDILGYVAWEQSGGSVSLSADASIVVIGAHVNSSTGNLAGHGRVLKNVNGTSWVQIGSDVSGSNQDMMGFSTAISDDGNIVAFGAPFADAEFPDVGKVKIYDVSLGNLVQVGADINGLVLQESLGYAISLSKDGSVIAIGSPYNSSYKTQSGQVKIFQNFSGHWYQIGNDIGGDENSGNNAYDLFGYSVSISDDGSIVAVGAPQKSGSTSYAGSVKIYKFIDDVWTQIGSTIQGKDIGEQFGRSVSISSDGLTLAVGAPLNYGQSGQARVYQYSSGNWTQIGNDIKGEWSGIELGKSISISGDGSVLAVGLPYNSENGYESGQTRIFKNRSGNWSLETFIIEDSPSSYSGYSVSLSSNGTKIAVGAPGNGQVGQMAGKTTVYDLSSTLFSDQFVKERTSIYPNPVKNELYIQLKDDLDLLQVTIYSVLGQVIRTENTNHINVSSLERGFYFVQVETSKGKALQKVLLD